MAKSPDGTTVVSAAADETLRFWSIFRKPTSRKSPADNATCSLANLTDGMSRLGVNCIR